MISLLIVDDEPVERAAMKLIIGNTVPEITSISEAENGFTALEIIRLENPDIVLMDINMPGMDGLETIGIARDQKTRSRFIILTSYNRFDYAQKAIKLGVEDFILKPAGVDSIKVTFHKVITDLQSENQSVKTRQELENRLSSFQPILESDLVSHIILGPTGLDLAPLLAIIDATSKKAFVAVMETQQDADVIRKRINDQLDRFGLKRISAVVEDRVILAVMMNDEFGELIPEDIVRYITHFMDGVSKSKYSIGIGDTVTDMNSLNDSYRTAVRCLGHAKKNHMPTCFPGQLTEDATMPSFQIVGYVDDLVEAIVSGETPQIFSIAEEFLKELHQYCADDHRRLRQYVNTTLLLVQQKVADNNNRFVIKDVIGLDKGVTLDSENFIALRSYFQNQIRYIADRYAEIRHSSQDSIGIRARQYILDHYRESITLEKLAADLNISSHYASKVISREIGRTFTELLTQVRLDEAKQLLINGELSIKEITYSVGFSSQHYFSRLFRKFTGRTPTDFRDGSG